MSEILREYPDNSELHARKAAWRKERAHLSFAEKLLVLDEMRERVAPIVRAREGRKTRQAADI